MKEFGDALKIVFSKVVGFFDIFDLSFFVSGLGSATAIATFLYHLGVPVVALLGTKIGVFLAALISYTLGLVSFALGRLIQKSVARIVDGKPQDITLDERFEKSLEAHGLSDDQQVIDYLSRGKDGTRALYTLLWAQMRHSTQVSASLELLNSYWVKAATYDGLSVSLLLWSFVLFCSSFGWMVPKYLGHLPSAVVIAILLGTAFACLREGRRYREYQVKELVATIVASRIKC